MPKCSHDTVRINMTIDREVLAVISVSDATQVVERPVTLRMNAGCPQCSYSAVFTVYPNRSDGYGWSRWPKWLLRRLQVLRMESPAIEEALRAFDFDKLKM